MYTELSIAAQKLTASTTPPYADIMRTVARYAHYIIVVVGWLMYMSLTDQWYLFADGWYMSLTMVAGSFVAGASSEGGGAVAFPVMTLLYKIPPEVARNFSFAIQSVGMTSAAYVIIRRGIPIEWRYLGLASIGGTFGVVLGALFVAPHIPPAYAKMLFVSVWLSFACILFYINEMRKRHVCNRLPILTGADRAKLLIAGVIGGCLSSIVGSGIDILTFSYVTMRFSLSEKVATPTSVVLMAGNTAVGFAMHAFILGDFGPIEFNYWLVCIPVVVFGAPLGAYFASQRSRLFIARSLCTIIVIQFFGACAIIKPKGVLLIFSIAIFVAGMIYFISCAKRSAKS